MRAVTSERKGTIEQVDVGRTHALYRDAGELSVRWCESSVLVVLRDHGQGGFSSIIRRYWDEALLRTPRVTLLADFWSMPTYDSPLRLDLTSWLLDHRPRVAELHVLTRSRIVTMGVAVANLALGGLVTNHRTRAPFDEAVARFPFQSARPSEAKGAG